METYNVGDEVKVVNALSDMREYNGKTGTVCSISYAFSSVKMHLNGHTIPFLSSEIEKVK